MARGTGRQGALVRVGRSATGGGGMLRRYGPAGAARVTLPRAPQELRELPLQEHAKAVKKPAAKKTPARKPPRPPKAPKVTTKKKGATAARHTGGGSHGAGHTLTADEVVGIVVAALAGGDLRLAVQDIALQVFWELASEQQSAMAQGGSYQRLGGF